MKRQQHLKQFIDLIGPSGDWPRQIRQLLFGGKHLNNSQRFQTTVFLLCNGVNPILIKAFYKDCFKFDDQANRQIDWIIKKYPTSKWMQWNVSQRKSM